MKEADGNFTICARTSYQPDFHGESVTVNFMLYQKNLKYQTNHTMEAGEPISIPDFSSSSACAMVPGLEVRWTTSV